MGGKVSCPKGEKLACHFYGSVMECGCVSDTELGSSSSDPRDIALWECQQRRNTNKLFMIGMGIAIVVLVLMLRKK